MPYFNEVTNPKKALITRIVLRPKGIILCTKDYDCFLFKDNKKAIALYQVLELFQKHTEVQVQLWVHPDKNTKIGFEVLPGDAIKWFFSETEVTLEPQSADEEELLKQIKSLLPSFPKNHDEAMGERRKKKTDVEPKS
jgi:predicted site-specific integrase-resolvase